MFKTRIALWPAMLSFTAFVSLISLFTMLLAFWWILTERSLQAMLHNQAWLWGVGVSLVVAIGLVYQGWRLNLAQWRWSIMAKLIGFFLWQSWSGGWDVAKRALAVKPNLTPHCIDYPLQLQGWRRQCWVAMIGLFPGTLSVAVSEQTVQVHVLDHGLDVQPGLVKLENYLAQL